MGTEVGIECMCGWGGHGGSGGVVSLTDVLCGVLVRFVESWCDLREAKLSDTDEALKGAQGVGLYQRGSEEDLRPYDSCPTFTPSFSPLSQQSASSQPGSGMLNRDVQCDRNDRPTAGSSEIARLYFAPDQIA